MPEKSKNNIDEKNLFMFSENEKNIRNDFTANYTAMVKMGQSTMWTSLLMNLVMLIVSLIIIGSVAIQADNILSNALATFLYSSLISGVGCMTIMMAFGTTYLSQESFWMNYYPQIENIRRSLLTDSPYQFLESKSAKNLQIMATILVIFSYLLVITVVYNFKQPLHQTELRPARL